ncbi:ATP-binding protein [Actinoplanes friuliensis]|uniref:histidine kinase n=1 Tax=Actinoplanes friuliensis DSM 7358 TaxID=1246995 RepID=U5VV13_9ACTN|nr:ATP-binding protein [Actinoplanes friuliensis]AGZ39496.1 putative multi-sensor signal transduction histidine kinase [Actinoplanes friuliensis DSM 7358]
MLTVDEALLRDPSRLAAVADLRPALAALPVLLDSVAAVAARSLAAPIALVSLVGESQEYLYGTYDPAGALAGRETIPLATSMGKYVLGANGCVRSTGVSPAARFGVSAFAGVPLKDHGNRPVGCLAVLDTENRRWSAGQTSLLSELARILSPEVLASIAPTAPTAAADAAEDNDRFLAAILDSLAVGVIACDEAGKIVLVNRALRDVQSLPGDRVPEDYAERAETTLVHSDMTPMSWQQTPLMRALRGEHVRDSEVLVQAPGHRLRTFATNAQPIIGAGGRRLGAVAAAHEVTAMRRAEHFRQCHLAVAHILAASDSPEQAAFGVLRVVATTLRWPYAEMWLIDEATDSLRSIGHWSEPGLKAGKLSRRAVTKGVGVTGRTWATGRPVWIHDITSEAAAEPHPRIEACLRLGFRTVLSVPVRDGDTMLGVLTCYSDAPEHHEDLLTVLLDGVAAQFGVFVALRRAAALAQELDRAKDDFIALVGHEMRTPLTTIAATAGMLREEAESFEPETQHMLAAIHRNTILLQDIVGKLLDLAGLEAGHIGLTIAPVDLVEVITEAMTAARPAASANGLTLIAELPDRLTVEADAGRFRQVVDDLLSNAVKYSPGGGDIHVRLSADDTTAELVITDGGIGVLDTEREHLFDRLYRGSNVRHQGTTGSGLGLSLARTIVELHGGTITLTGRETGGTTVQVRLPLQATSPSSR